MTDKINGRTPEEIKKGLECCQTDKSKSCKPCPYVRSKRCLSELNADALAYIQQLERERDAAVEDLKQYRQCETCKHYAPDTFCSNCRGRGSAWEWRGVQEVE